MPAGDGGEDGAGGGRIAIHKEARGSGQLSEWRLAIVQTPKLDFVAVPEGRKQSIHLLSLSPQ